MAKNIKSNNSKLAKFFLLGCANAAILTAMPQNVMANRTTFGEISEEQTLNFMLKSSDPRLVPLQKKLKGEICCTRIKGT